MGERWSLLGRLQTLVWRLTDRQTGQTASQTERSAGKQEGLTVSPDVRASLSFIQCKYILGVMGEGGREGGLVGREGKEGV